MSRWPFVLVAALITLPILLMAGVGAWAIWNSGHWFWLSWAIPICWSLAWVVLQLVNRIEVPLPEVGSKIHWTPRDQSAAAIIKAEQKRVAEFTGEQLIDPQFYTTRTIEIATAFAKHYHPKATDPLGAVSVVELLTVVQLVAEDLEKLLRENVPGSHLVTVAQWKMLANAPAWWRTINNIGWLASVIINPVSVARYAVSKAFVDPMSKQIQTNVLGAFYAIFVQQLGFYLIELNSGRLRGGSARYRAAMHRLEPAPQVTDAPREAQPPNRTEPVSVTIAVIGQVKAGKSSLVNCLIGEQQAAVDILPLTRSVARYDMQVEGNSDRLILLDTPGYSDSGATSEQMSETREAVRNADLVLLVLDARSPAKQADITALDDLAVWFRDQHRLKPPAIVGVVSKIDGLSPVMEWAPPYSWEQPTRPKEHSIHAAVEFARQTFASRVESMVPVCTDREHGHVFGVNEYLLPTISLFLDEARAVSLVRSLHREYDQERAWKVVGQLISAGTKIQQFAPAFTKTQLQQVARTILGSVIKNP
ncbi:GTPase family protein [Schlesneria paludicola]|uniref:GTPase family protein n=1 Tax=Schlesneria paludicola TaxID=360056 RepID=UPI00029A0F22|nr:GTPase [Schlesneria paludicola]